MEKRLLFFTLVFGLRFYAACSGGVPAKVIKEIQ
jgi:hypothetical protein